MNDVKGRLNYLALSPSEWKFACSPPPLDRLFLVPAVAACSQLLLKSVSKLFENVEWSSSLLRHFKIQTLLKINCSMEAISAFGVTQYSQIFSLFFRNRIQCIALYQLHNSQALLNLPRGYYRNYIARPQKLNFFFKFFNKLLMNTTRFMN